MTLTLVSAGLYPPEIHRIVVIFLSICLAEYSFFLFSFIVNSQLLYILRNEVTVIHVLVNNKIWTRLIRMDLKFGPLVPSVKPRREIEAFPAGT